LGRVYKYSVLRGLHLQAGSRRLGFKPNTMTTKKMRFGLGCGYDVYPGGLESDTLGLGPQASEALDGATESFLAIKFGSLLVGAFLPPVCQKVVVPTGEALGGSTGTFPEFKSGSLSVGLSPLVAPVDISVSSNQPALVRQEVTTTNGMGSVLANTPPEGADPGLCKVWSRLGAWSMVLTLLTLLQQLGMLPLGVRCWIQRGLCSLLWGRLRWERGFVFLFR